MVGSHFCGIPENSDFNTNTNITNILMNHSVARKG